MEAASEDMASIDPLESLNKRRSRLVKLEDQLRMQQDAHLALKASIEDYKLFVPSLERDKLDTLVATAANLSRQITEAERIEARLDQKLQQVRSSQINPLLFWKSFSAEQKQLRTEAKGLQRERSSVEQQLGSERATLSKTNSHADLARKRLADHETFNLDSASNQLSTLSEAIKRIKADHAVLSAELAKIEILIQPHVHKRDSLKDEVSKLNNDIETANLFDQELSSASNSYEKAMVHQECEAKFGTGSPRQVIRDRSGKIRHFENNIPKLERRIREELEKFDRTIDHLLIDGNNVCYEGQSFIGLRAISALLAEVEERYRITIVFDANIRSLLKTDTQSIEQLLGPSVATHITPTKTGADEYLLKLAGKNPNAFILSNDRYAEYHEYDAVKSGRLLRFLIADGKIMVNDLDIMANI